MRISKIDDITVESNAMVRVKAMGNITEIMYMDNYSSRCTIKRLDRDNYIDLRTGETKEFVHIKDRSCDLKGISKTLGRLRDYLNTNITDVSRCRWVTLTYRDNITDTNKLKTDFMHFNSRLRKKVGAYEYIVAMEPQGRGAWHCHVVMIFPSKAPYIANEVIWSSWSPKGYKAYLKDGKGYDYTKVKRLDQVDNVGAYLTAYLGDMELSEFNANLTPEMCSKTFDVKEVEIEEDGSKKKKAFVKGARLYMYPPKFNLYRCSRGIKKPVIFYDSEVEAQKKVSAATLTFQKTIQLDDLDNNFSKTINYRYYNSLRDEK